MNLFYFIPPRLGAKSVFKGRGASFLTVASYSGSVIVKIWRIYSMIARCISLAPKVWQDTKKIKFSVGACPRTPNILTLA